MRYRYTFLLLLYLQGCATVTPNITPSSELKESEGFIVMNIHDFPEGAYLGIFPLDSMFNISAKLAGYDDELKVISLASGEYKIGTYVWGDNKIAYLEDSYQFTVKPDVINYLGNVEDIGTYETVALKITDEQNTTMSRVNKQYPFIAKKYQVHKSLIRIVNP